LRVLSHQYLRRRALLAENYDAVRALDAAAALLRAAPPVPALEAVASAPLPSGPDETAPAASSAVEAGEGRGQPESAPEVVLVAAEMPAAETESRPADDEPAGQSGEVAGDLPIAPLPAMRDATEEAPAATPPAPVVAAAVAATFDDSDQTPSDGVAITARGGQAAPGAVELAVAGTIAGKAIAEAADRPESAGVQPVAISGDSQTGPALLLLHGTTRLGEVVLENGRVYTVGSGRGADIVLAGHGAAEEAPVAAEHARLTVRRGRVLFHHVGEQFESKVNGAATEWAVIEAGDEIEIGDYVLRCEAGAA
jgi:hypothetical protein